MRLHCLVLVASLYLAGPAVAAPAAREQSLGSIPPGAAPNQRIFTTDLSHVAQVVCQEGGCAVYLNGVAGSRFDSIVKHTLRFTRGNVLAYAGRRGTQTVVVVAGKEFELQASLDPPRFAINPAVNHDGSKLAAVTLGADGKTVRTFDSGAGASKDFGPFAEVLQTQFTADDRLVFSAKRDNKSFIVADGVEGAPFDTMGLFSVSPNGKRIGYPATTAGVTRYYIDGALSEPVGGFTSPVDFSPDSRRYAYSYMSLDGPMHYVLDGKVTPGTSGGGMSTTFIFSADSKHVAYAVVDDKDRQAFTIDGVVQPFFKIVNELKFWSDGEKFKFVYSRIDGAGKPGFIYIGGRTPNLERYEGDMGLAWSPDGRSFTYKGAQRSGKRVAPAVFVDGKRATPVGFDAVSYAVFSLQGHQSAHLAKGPNDSFVLVVDGKKRLNIDGMPLTPVRATADGFAFIVQRRAEHRRIDWQDK